MAQDLPKQVQEPVAPQPTQEQRRNESTVGLVVDAAASPPKPEQKQGESHITKVTTSKTASTLSLGESTDNVERKSPQPALVLSAPGNSLPTSIMSAAASLTGAQGMVLAERSPSTSAAPALTTTTLAPGASPSNNNAAPSMLANIAALAPQALTSAPGEQATPPTAATVAAAQNAAMSATSKTAAAAQAAAGSAAEKAGAAASAAQSTAAAAVEKASGAATAAQAAAGSAADKAGAAASAAQSTAAFAVEKASGAATAAQAAAGSAAEKAGAAASAAQSTAAAAVEKASGAATAAQAAAGSAAEKAGAAASAAQSTAAAAVEKASGAATAAQAAAGSAAEKTGAAASAAQSTAAAAVEKASRAATAAQAAAGSAAEKAGAAASAAQSTAATAVEKASGAATAAQAAAGSAAEKTGAAASAAQSTAAAAVEKAGSLTQRAGSAIAWTSPGNGAAAQAAAPLAAVKPAEAAAAATSPSMAPATSASPSAPATMSAFAGRAASAISAVPAAAASAASQTGAAANALAGRAASAVTAAPAASANPVPAVSTTEITATVGTPTPSAAGTAATPAVASGPSVLAPPVPPSSATSTAAAAAPAAGSATDRLKEQIMKEAPKIAADAAKQAGKAYVEAGKEAGGTLKLLMGLREKEGPPITLTVDQLATAAFLVLAALPLLALPLFMPPMLRLLYSLSWGLLIGLGLSYLYYTNARAKKETNELLGINLGLKGLQQVVGSLPSTFSVSDSEKMEWLNALVEEIWPFLDKAICNMIKAEVEKAMPGILKSLPGPMNGIISSIGFQHLTFGGAPFRVEGIWVDPDEKKSLVLEVSIKWCGDPNITLAIATTALGTACPRVLDISLVASMRIKLSPLVDRIPGFVAAMVTMPRAPMIKYRLDFGKALGGAALPAAVTPVINYFLKEIISGMLVWPQRLVVPILQESQEDFFSAQLLMRRNCGLLRVCVVKCTDIAKSDAGVNDISIECSTEGLNYEATSVCPAGIRDPNHHSKLIPVNWVKWCEYLYLLVQEPRNQVMRLQAADYPRATTKADASAKARKDIIGRALVKLSTVTKAAEEADPALAEEEAEIPIKVNLGMNDWGYPGGPGKGAGKVRLNMRYFPYEQLTAEHMRTAGEAIVTCRLLKIRGITPAGPALTATCGIITTEEKAKGMNSRKTYTQTWTAARWEARLKFRIKLVEQALDAMGDEDSGDEDGDADPSVPSSRKASVANLAAAGPTEPATPIKAGAPPKVAKAAKPGALKDKKKALRRKKQEELARLQRELAAGPVTELDYTLDASNLHAMHHVKPTFTNKDGKEEDNCVVVSVKDNKKQMLAHCSVPIKLIRDSTGINPITGKLEHGSFVQAWDNNVPGKPGERIDDEMQWGVKMEGNSERIRLWAIFRYVPYIPGPALDREAADAEELDNFHNPPKTAGEEVAQALENAGEKVVADIKQVVEKVEAGLGITGSNPGGDANGTQLKDLTP